MEPRYLIAPILVIALLVTAVTVMASMLIPVADQAKENARAPEKSSAIAETEAGNWDLEKVDFIHYAKPEKPPKGPKAGKCNKMLGVKWKSLPVGYVVNPTNPDNLSVDFVGRAISTSSETWDAATSSELFWDLNIIDYNAQYGIQDSKNAIVFGDYPDENVIAVTSVWFTRRGRQIVEFDILFDTDFRWGDATNPPTEEICTAWESKCIEWNPSNLTGPPSCLKWEEVCTNWTTITLEVMDLQNIATHEFGHGVGLDDVYRSACSEVTMYGYSEYGEIKKRTLEQPDTAGIQRLYGA